ncbi:hypothetical protein DKG79_17320 [Escherichia fergusonii]|nr:hypothetical protein DKG79_17320 [Escherichia fergusonii]
MSGYVLFQLRSRVFSAVLRGDTKDVGSQAGRGEKRGCTSLPERKLREVFIQKAEIIFDDVETYVGNKLIIQ